jgi:hypothetical protein
MNGIAGLVKMVLGDRRDTCMVVVKVGVLRAMDVSER